MNRGLALLLQGVIALIGAGILILMLMEPHFEGRNAHATVFEVYFKDPFLAYVYIGSIPFFVALHRAVLLFSHAGRTGAFSRATVDHLRAIKRCAFVLIGFVLGAAGFIVAFGDGEDRPGGIFMCFLAICASSVIAMAAARLARNLKTALERA